MQKKPNILIAVIVAFSILFSYFKDVHAFSFSAEINKKFTPISIVAGQISRLDITIFNPNLFQLENASFTDSLIGRQPGLHIATPSNLTNTCGGVVIAAAGTTTISLSGGTVPPQVGSTPGTCVISVDVTSTTPGNLINTIPAYGETPSYGGEGLYATARGGLDVITNTNSASATLQVNSVQPPSLSKSFSPATTWVGQSTQLEINLFNNDLNTALTEATYTDYLPPSFTVSSPLTTSLSGCGSATLSANVGDTSITLNNATIAPNSNCRVRVRVISSTQGQYTNTIPAGPAGAGSVQTRQGVTNLAPASGNINVQAVGITKTIVPENIQQGDTSLLTITLRNPTGSPYTGVSITDNLPAGVTIFGTPAVNQCGGTVSFPSDTRDSITLTSGVVPAGNVTTPGTCTIVTQITSTTVGNHINTIPAGALQGPITNAFPASDNLNVQARVIAVRKDFGGTLVVGGTTALTIRLANAASTTLTGVTFTDTLPANLLVVGTPTASASCGGSAVVTSTPSSITLSNGVIPPGTVSNPGYCYIYATVTTTVNAAYSNVIPAGDVTSDQGVTNTASNTATTTAYPIGGNATVGKAFSPTTISAGGSSRLQITITAPNDTGISGISLTDNLPGDLVILGSPAPVTNCAGATLVTQTGTQVIQLSGGSITTPGTSCTVTVYVTSNTSGVYTNTLPGGSLSTFEGRTDPTTRSTNLTVTEFSISKQFTPTTVNPNGISRLSIYLSNKATVPLINVTLTDTLPSGLSVAPSPEAESTCDGGTFNPIPLSQTVSITGTSVPPSDGVVPGLCRLSVNVIATGSPGSRINTITTSNVLARISGTTTDIRPVANAQATLTVGSLSIQIVKGFSPESVLGGSYSVMSIELNNPNNAPLSGIGFVDTMPEGMILADPPAFDTGDCGGTLSAAADLKSFTYSGGSLPSSGRCTLTLHATMNVTGTLTNTIPAGAVTTSEGATNPDAASASLVNLPGASLSKSFSPNPVPVGVYSLLTITIWNQNDITLTGMGLVDTLPDDLTISNAIPSVNYCGGTLTAIPGNQQIALEDGTIGPSESCMMVIPVVSDIANSYQNIIPADTLITEEEITNGDPAEDTLVVTAYSLGNRVWEDNGAGTGIANNGLRDGSEPGLAGVTVRLYADLNNDDTPDGAQIATTTTDASGYYRFDDLTPGDYIVEVVIPSGYIASTVNFGDPDNNTDNDNNGVISGTGTVRSYSVTLEDTHIEPEDDNDPATNPESGEAPNEYSNRTVDFGLFRPYTLGNRVWNDNGAGGGNANNGFLDGTEPGIPNVIVRLYRDSDNNGTPDGSFIAYTTTDANGYYWFNNLIADTYIVEIIPPSGYLPAAINAGDPDNNADNDNNGVLLSGLNILSDPVTLGPDDSEPLNDNDPLTNPITGESPNGYSNRTVDFALIQTYSLGNRVWNDNGTGTGGSPNDGVRNGTEPGLSGVTVYLYPGVDANSDGVPDQASLASTTTDGSGYYRFDNVITGDYIIGVLPPAGFASSANNSGDPDNNIDNDNNSITSSGGMIYSSPISLGPDGGEPTNDNDPTTNPQAGEAPNAYSNRTLDFGLYQPPYSIGNRVWNDNGAGSSGIAGNGIVDGEEPGMANAVVRLYRDTNGDETPDGFAIASIITNADGYYRFDNLTAGQYIVEVVVPSGFVSSTYSTLGPDLDPTDNDDNGVFLVGNAIRSHTITLEVGGLEPLGELDPNPNPATGAAADAYGNLTVDFGFTPLASLGDRVWLDSNYNGFQDSGESGITGVTVRLYSGEDTLLATTTTSGGGLYSFTDLLPGDYYVIFTLPGSSYSFSPQNQGGDDNVDSDANITTGQTATTTLIAGENDISWDAGMYQPPASIGDLVWYDTDLNGIQDAGESGVAGVTVSLFRPDYGPDGIYLTADDADPVGVTTTGGTGLYSFTNLVPGTYFVQFTLPAGYAFSPLNQGGDDTLDSDADRSTGQTIQTTLDFNENDPTWDAGIYQLASIGDRVWNDFNQNGIQDVGEAGINNVVVELYTGAGSLVASTSTTTIGGVDGSYNFSNLEPGDYYLVFYTPGGFAVTSQDQGGDDAADSDINPATGQTVVTTLSSGENDVTWDAGYYQLASLGDRVWNDLNQNGIQDAGESGVNGVTVDLYNSTGTLIGTTTTSGGGLYSFTNLEPGEYYLDFTEPYGFAFVSQNQGSDDTLDSDVNPVNGTTVLTTLIPNENDTSWDAGIYQLLSSIGNRVWVDENGNGIQDAGEAGLNGVTVDLYDSANNLVGTTTTGTVGSDDGIYAFSDLIPDYYYLVFTPPSGYYVTLLDQGADDALDSDANRTNGRTNLTLLDPGEDDLTWDMGLYQTTALGNRVWLDLNANGIQDSGELGVNGVTVNLYRVGFGLVDTSLTAPDGSEQGIYLFENLVPGDYYVEFVLPSGFHFSPVNEGSDSGLDSDADTTSGQTTTTTLVSGETDLTWDAGIYQYAAMGDHVWLDTNGNGIQNAGESGMAGVTVDLYSATGISLATTTTDANGDYLFSDLVPGEYYVTFTPPSGYAITLQNQGSDDALDSDADRTSGETATTELVSNETDLTWDAGLYLPASIGDFVWLDENGNGVQDSGELGIESVSVSLYTSTGSLVDTTTTASDGSYLFADLIPGDYYLTFTPPDGYAITLQNQGGDDTLDSDIDRTTGQTAITSLTSDEVDLTWDAGMYIPASLGDFVWVDLNANGVQNSGEIGLADVTVNLYESGGSLVDSTTTASNGSYTFTNLIPGTYYLEFVPPTGYAFSPLDAGADDSADSDANILTGQTGNTTLVSGENDGSWDAGLYQLTTLGNKVWNDLNTNGIQDIGEPGVNDVTVRLYDSTNTLIATTTTANVLGEDGIYAFVDLVPGEYHVEFVLPGGYVFTLANQGSDDTLDSDPNRFTGVAPSTTLISNEIDLTWDAGIYQQIGRIGVAKRVVGSPVEVSSGTWDITYEILVRNYSNVPLTSVQVTDDFSATFATGATFIIQSVTSSDFTVNSAYTGSAGNLNLLEGTDTLDVNESGTITVVVRVVPQNFGPFNNSANGSGQPIIGQPVTDPSQNGNNPDPDSNGDPTDNNDPTPVDFGPNLFDPPFGIKILDASSLPILQWTMDWINDTNIVAINASVSDEIPVGTSYYDNLIPNDYPLPPGDQPFGTTTNGVSCTDDSGVTITQYCYYEGPTGLYPRGRIVWQGVLGPDLGIRDPQVAVNDIRIVFSVTRLDGVRRVRNTAFINADRNGDGDTDDPNEIRVFSASESWNAPKLPETGFAPGVSSILPEQPVEKAYTQTGGMSIQIPALSKTMPVVGVPITNGQWDLTWLNNQAGYLAGTAFPTQAGNSVITGHVYLPDGNPGPFSDLSKLKYGDQIIITAYGQKYIYEVREVNRILPDSQEAFTHSDYPVLTLVTCQGYDETSGLYLWRYYVRAVQIKIEN